MSDHSNRMNPELLINRSIGELRIAPDNVRRRDGRTPRSVHGPKDHRATRFRLEYYCRLEFTKDLETNNAIVGRTGPLDLLPTTYS